MALQVCHLSVLRKPIERCCSSFLSSSYKTSPSFSMKLRSSKTGSPSDSVISHAYEVMGSVASRGSVLKCSSSAECNQTEMSDLNQLVELPLFPLPLVLFPGVTLPMQIFEFRYRIMMHTLLEGDLRFGIIYSDSSSGTVDVGCVGEVVKHERLVDDRFFLICKGQERFRVVNLVRTKPYLVAEVQLLGDRPSGSDQQDLEALALEVETCMKDVMRLSNKLKGKLEKESQDLRGNLCPTQFSFFVGSTFEGAPKEQQALLEMEDTAMRFKREKETLRTTLNYLAAACAVNDAFQFSSFNEN